MSCHVIIGYIIEGIGLFCLCGIFKCRFLFKTQEKLCKEVSLCHCYFFLWFGCVWGLTGLSLCCNFSSLFCCFSAVSFTCQWRFLFNGSLDWDSLSEIHLERGSHNTLDRNTKIVWEREQNGMSFDILRKSAMAVCMLHRAWLTL